MDVSNEGFVSCEGSGFVRLAMLLPGLVIKFFLRFHNGGSVVSSLLGSCSQSAGGREAASVAIILNFCK